MDDDTLARLIALIPSDLTTLDIRLDVFEFVPSPKRDYGAASTLKRGCNPRCFSEVVMAKNFW